ncbi:MAG: glycosyltransferase family 4 protein [Salinivirgaceae bacterium]|nr:glycosyltransferase family 4 protein [Salinivirgaceae bacterium]
MKILFITHHYLTGNSGGAFASRAYINAFDEVADDMTLLYPVRDGQNLFDGINPKIKTIPVAYNMPKWRKLIHSIMGYVHRYYETANEFLTERKADIVVFDTCVVTFKLIKRFKAIGYKTMVIHHNYQYEYFRDNSRGPLKWITLFWCRKYEREAVREADINLTLTSQDVELLANNYNNGNKSNFKVLGTFEYCRKPLKPITDVANQNRFVITGSLSSMQTYISLESWIRDYYPILKSVFPESILTVAGKNPSAGLVNLCQSQGIRIIASPPNMDDILCDADYYICPTSLGGGLKLRIMDGLQWGLPVVTHAVSARGYDAFKDAGCLFTYNNIEEFADALRRLKTMDFDKKKVQTLYNSIFSFDAGVERLKSIL